MWMYERSCSSRAKGILFLFVNERVHKEGGWQVRVSTCKGASTEVTEHMPVSFGGDYRVSCLSSTIHARDKLRIQTTGFEVSDQALAFITKVRTDNCNSRARHLHFFSFGFNESLVQVRPNSDTTLQ
jgi:hypothetical protein